MGKSRSGEANIHSTSQEIPHLLWSLRTYNNPPLVPILNQMNPFHNFRHYFP